MKVIQNSKNLEKRVHRNNLAIIISSPSGAGKTTIARKLLSKVKNSYLSISCTTREPRKGEKHGVDYFFLSKSKFRILNKKKKFLESAKVYDNYYGTLWSEIKKSKKKIILLDVDWQGARSIRKVLKENCYSFFLLPPSLKILKKRLIQRHNDNKKIAYKRFSSAKKDIKHWPEYNFVYVNKNLNKCVNEIYKQIFNLIKVTENRSIIKNLVKKF